MPFQAPDRLSDAYFPGASFGTRDGKIGEIDAGDDEDQQADNAEHPDVVNKAARYDTILEVAEQMPILEGVKKGFEFLRLVAILIIFFINGLKRRLRPSPVDVGLQGNKSLDRIKVPVAHIIPDPILCLDKVREWDDVIKGQGRVCR